MRDERYRVEALAWGLEIGNQGGSTLDNLRHFSNLGRFPGCAALNNRVHFVDLVLIPSSLHGAKYNSVRMRNHLPLLETQRSYSMGNLPLQTVTRPRKPTL